MSFWKAAGARALRTFLQALLGTLPLTVIVGVGTDWLTVGWAAVSIIGSAAWMALLSFLTSAVKALPELES